MKRYICKECVKMYKKEGKCDACGGRLDEVEMPRGLDGLIPFVLAAIAAFFLFIGFLFDYHMLIWFTFPIVGAGLLYDHLYEKQVEKALEETIYMKNKNG
ncbi:MAG: hypothetical protein ACLFSM_02435 [Thermoplasmata archaeon]